ncbi:MAG TPA: hypothetical protein PKW55_01420 [Spirochaetota bacterium]|nr:hypothetical protein [Spirochaetota bacterium]HOM38850.1 hypothetical protein [Spirochaetota bacterium]HPQ49145.1 hypothetical protein [Spirochaetota bacterium]
MFDLFIKALREQKAILITVIVGLFILGLVLGLFRKEKIKVREIDPTIIYREEVLSKIKNEENIKPESIEDIIKDDTNKENKSDNIINESKKEETKTDDLKIEKTPMDELIEK